MSTPGDEFERPAGPLGTSCSGHPWTERPTGPYNRNTEATQAQVTSLVELNGLGKAVWDGPQSVNHVQLATLDWGTGDIDAECEWTTVFVPGFGTGLGQVFRWQDPTHFWNVFWYDAAIGGQRVFLERYNGPTFADVNPRMNVAVGSISGDTTLRVVAVDDDIEVFLDGVSVIAITHAAYKTATHHGISNYGSGFGHNRYNICPPGGWVDGAGPMGAPIASGWQ